MIGKPVLSFQIGDLVRADPVLGEVPFRFRVDDPEDAAVVIRHNTDMTPHEYGIAARSATDYVRAYLHPVTEACIDRFLSESA